MLEVSGAIPEQLGLKDDIPITILDNSGNQVRIGIDMPDNPDALWIEVFSGQNYQFFASLRACLESCARLQSNRVR